MAAERIVYELLRSNSTVTDIVGEEIHHQFAPQFAGKPYIVVSHVHDDQVRHLRGRSGVLMVTLMVECVAGNVSTLFQLEDAVRGALDDFRGDAADFFVQWIFWEPGGLKDNDQDSAGSDKRLFRRQLDFLVVWEG